MSEEEKVSAVVLAGTGQYSLLAALFSATIFQSRLPDELVIIDFCSKPVLSVPSIAEGFSIISERLPIIYRALPSPDHHGKARIEGFSVANYQWIWWLEDDVIVSSETLSELLKLTSHSQLAVPRQLCSKDHLAMLVDNQEKEMLANYIDSTESAIGYTNEPLLHGSLMSRALCESMEKHWLKAVRCSDVVVGYEELATVAYKALAFHCRYESDKSAYFVPMLKNFVRKYGTDRL